VENVKRQLGKKVKDGSYVEDEERLLRVEALDKIKFQWPQSVQDTRVREGFEMPSPAPFSRLRSFSLQSPMEEV